MKPVVVTTSPGFGMVGRVPETLNQRGWEFIRCVDTNIADGGLSEHIGRADFLVVGLIPATKETIARGTKLKGILKHGVGVDNIDILAASAKKIPVLNTPGANANAVAELAVGCMFSLARHIPMVHKAVVEGGWQRYVGTEIQDKTIGIVGLGNIGKKLALKAKALGMSVLAHDLYPDNDFIKQHGIELVDFQELLKKSDYISLHVFGGGQNQSLIGANELALMKKTACIMNFARGDVVDLDALTVALQSEQIKGAAIDAYIQEPPDRVHPVFSLPNVVFTPHSGADTTESVERVGLMNIEDIDTLLLGGRPQRVLNPEIY